MDTAVGGGERAARSAPAELDQLGGDRDRRLLGSAGPQVQADRGAQPGKLGLGEPGLPEPGEPVLVRPAAAHGADVAGRGAQRHLQQRNVELRIVGQHADHGALVDIRAGQVTVRPFHDDLVGVTEPRRGGEDAARVAYGHAVAEELPDPGDRGGEVDRAEDQHPRRRRERVDEHRQLIVAALALRAVAAHGRLALGQHAPHVVVGRGVQPVARAEAARGGPVRVDDAPGPDDAGPADHGGDRHRLLALHRGGQVTQLGEQLTADRLDEHVQDAAAGQADREGVVVADPVGLQGRPAARDDLAAQLVHGALDTPARHAADHLAVGGGGQRGPGLTRRAAERADHRGQTERLARVPPFHDVVQDVAHVTTSSRRLWLQQRYLGFDYSTIAKRGMSGSLPPGVTPRSWRWGSPGCPARRPP